MSTFAKIRAKGQFPTKIKEQRPGSQSYDAKTNLTTFEHDLNSPTKSGRVKLIVKIGISIGLFILGLIIGICL